MSLRDLRERHARARKYRRGVSVGLFWAFCGLCGQFVALLPLLFLFPDQLSLIIVTGLDLLALIAAIQVVDWRGGKAEQAELRAVINFKPGGDNAD
jgi:hypothetical protein